jgi:hypothetical protein
VLGVGATFAGHGLLHLMKRIGKSDRLEPVASHPPKTEEPS